MNIPIVYIDVSYVIALWFTLYYVLAIHCWVIEAWSPMKGKKVGFLVLPSIQVWNMNYLDNNDVIWNLLLWCWWQGITILTPSHLN